MAKTIRGPHNEMRVGMTCPYSDVALAVSTVYDDGAIGYDFDTAVNCSVTPAIGFPRRGLWVPIGKKYGWGDILA